MAPFNLQGLNVVHPAPSPATQDSNDPLTSPLPDFSAHLDLWTNLAFDSDEPLASNKGKRKLADEDDEIPPPFGLPNKNSHEHVVHPPPAPNSTTASQNPHIPPLDINALISSFGIDPLLLPAVQPAPIQGNIPNHLPPVPSLAQLLALHAAYGGTYTVPPPPAIPPQLQPPEVAPLSQAPAPKRARAQKTSPSTDNSETRSPPATSPESPEDSTQADPTATTLSASEDKRRRNTAASARFRLKKKEREVALERRAKELEDRVVELERECEGLRRENGWLKGLVVGVTGAGAAQQQQAAAK